MPLKSVAKGKAHPWETLTAERAALLRPGAGRGTQACHGARQVEHLAIVGRAAMPQALQRTGRKYPLGSTERAERSLWELHPAQS